MKWSCQHGFPLFKQAKGSRGSGISSAGSDVASVGSVLSLKSPLPARCGSELLLGAAVGLESPLLGLALGLESKNIKKVPVQLTVYTAKIADMGLY